MNSGRAAISGKGQLDDELLSKMPGQSCRATTWGGFACERLEAPRPRVRGITGVAVYATMVKGRRQMGFCVQIVGFTGCCGWTY